MDKEKIKDKVYEACLEYATITGDKILEALEKGEAQIDEDTKLEYNEKEDRLDYCVYDFDSESMDMAWICYDVSLLIDRVKKDMLETKDSYKRIEEILDNAIKEMNQTDDNFERVLMLGASIEYLMEKTWVDKISKQGIILNLIRRLWFPEQGRRGSK